MKKLSQRLGEVAARVADMENKVAAAQEETSQKVEARIEAAKANAEARQDAFQASVKERQARAECDQGDQRVPSRQARPLRCSVKTWDMPAELG